MAWDFSRVADHVALAGRHFGTRYGIANIGGWRATSDVPNSDHTKIPALALDFMTSSKSRGDALAAEAIRDYRKWSITYVIWYRRIWTPSGGWRSYNGPSPHTDHVHISFAASPVGQAGMGSNPDSLQGQLGLDKINKVGDYLARPDTWRRAAFFATGLILALIGVYRLAFAKPVVQSVVKGVKNVSGNVRSG